MMKEIQQCFEVHRDIRNFVSKYSTIPISSKNQTTDLPKGLYLEGKHKFRGILRVTHE